jgi:hypothetical protein
MPSLSIDSSVASLWDSDFGRNYPYTYSYYSGSQIALYIGEVLIDEAVFISYDLRQPKRPIYGYASQYFDAIANGIVLIHGQIGINYIDNKYLPVIIYDTLSKQNQNPNESNIPMEVTSSLDYMTKLADLQGYATLNQMQNSAFRTAINKQKEKYWRNDTVANNAVPRPDQFGPIDIVISFGLPGNNNYNSTAKKLEAVYFTHESQTIEINGQPLIESYSFFARSIQNLIPT